MTKIAYDLDAGFDSLVATGFFLCARRVLTVRRFLTVCGSRFALKASGCILNPCGWEQGTKWDHIRVGSSPGGIKTAKQRPVLFSRFLRIRTPENDTSTAWRTLLAINPFLGARTNRSTTAVRNTKLCKLEKNENGSVVAIFLEPQIFAVSFLPVSVEGKHTTGEEDRSMWTCQGRHSILTSTPLCPAI